MITAHISQTNLDFGSAHKKHEKKAEAITKMPPIVGVPVLIWSQAGASFLTYCLRLLVFKKIINLGPNTNHTNIDVNAARIILKVIYLKTFKKFISFISEIKNL
jgi:hypothetical protein